MSIAKEIGSNTLLPISFVRYRLLQVLQCVVNHLLPYERCCRRAHRVVLVGIDHHIILLARLVESVTHLHRILEVYIVVGCTVNDKQLRALCQLLGVREW